MSSSGRKSSSRKKVRKSLSWRESKEAIKHDLEKFLQDKFLRGDKMERKREKVMTEIFASERRYLEQLNIIITHFLGPLRRSGLVPENDIRVMFGDLPAIQAINKELLAHMEEMSIGQAFLQLAPYIKLYCTYANNFEKAIDLIQEWENKTSDFVRFLKDQEKKEECRGLSLHALLITPIQRVPRYKLLLKQLLDSTPRTHTDYDNIKDALHQISQVTQGINEYIRQHENFQKMLDIQNSIGGKAPKLIIPGRRFLKEGPLMKVSKNGSGAHERMFFLFSDILLYAKHNTSLERPLLAKPYTCSTVILLADCKVDLVLGEKKIDGAGALFKLSYKDDHLLLYSTDNNTALSWIDQLQSAIQTHRENRASLRTPSVLEKRQGAFTREAGRTPFRSSMRLKSMRKKQLIEEEPAHSSPVSMPNKDMLYPMRKDILHLCEKKAIRVTPIKRKPPRGPAAVSTPPSRSRQRPLGHHLTPQPAVARQSRSSRRPRSLPPLLTSNKKKKKILRRLQDRGPKPLSRKKRAAPDPEQTVYEDAMSQETSSSTDDPDNTLYQTALNLDENTQPEIYPITPSRERNMSYRRGHQVLKDMPEIPAEQNTDSQCIIL